MREENFEMKLLITRYLKPYYFRMSIGFVIKFIGTIMDLCIPYVLAYIIDSVIPLGQKGPVFLWGGVMVACSICAAVFNIIANRMASRVASDATRVVRHDLFARVMNLSGHQMDEFTKPSIISRLTSDTYNIHQMLARIQRLGVRAPILLIGGICVTMTLDPVLSLVLLASLPILALITVLVMRKGLPLFTGLQEAADRMVRLVREDIAGIRVIKALSRTDHEARRFSEVNQEVVARDKKAGIVTAVLNPVMNLILNLGLVLVIIVGAYRVHAGTTEVGKILAFMTYFSIILNALMSISRMFVMLSKGTASANRVMDVVEAVDDMKVLELLEVRDWRKDHTEEKFSFEDVSFSYHKEIPDLEHITLSIKKGETLGIIGETGSGKTTLAALLMRLYDADEGTIRIDGRDVRTIEKAELRRKFGVVFQNDTIFEDTIEENVRLGRGLSEEEIRQALSYARASEFVEEKKDQTREHLDIRGANLSGGQKQRVLIARALAAHPEILILDDSSSALDYRTDAALRKEIREHFSDTTLVIIAQRISSISHADHILVLEDGKMSGYGTHEELLVSCPLYQEISRSQMGYGKEA